MNIQESLIQEMLQNIPDPKMREHYGKLASAKIVAKVRCLSEACNGRVIGYINSDSTVIEEIIMSKITKKNPTSERIAGIESSRDRFDGEKGFKCSCGNNSLVAAQEQGIMGPTAPSPKDLEQIALNIQKRPAQYAEIDGKKEVDGFLIERVTV